jgi:hypothetical protein
LLEIADNVKLAGFLGVQGAVYSKKFPILRDEDRIKVSGAERV